MQNSNQYMAKGCKPVLTQPNAFALGTRRTPRFEGCKPDIIISTNNKNPNDPTIIFYMSGLQPSNGGTYFHTQRDALGWNIVGFQPVLSNLLKSS